MNDKQIDLGTLISAEMYSVSENKKKKQKLNKNTFQQSTNENVRGEAPIFLPAPSEPLVRENLERNNGLGSEEPK